MFRITFSLALLIFLSFLFPVGCDIVPQYPPPSSSAIEANVVEVVDGDTITVRIDYPDNDRQYPIIKSVRYIGMDAPEVSHAFGKWLGGEPLGREAAEKNLELVGGETVMLEWDVSYADRYGRFLCYVWVDDIFVNAELVRLGFARAATYPPDTKYKELFEELEEKAKKKDRGIWSYPHPR